MFQQTEEGQKTKLPVIPIIVCACLSVFFMNFGILSMFFFAPLGYAVIVYNQAWLTFIAVAVINLLFSVIVQLSVNGSFSFMEVLYFSTLFFSFIWIMGGNKVINVSIRTAYRFILSAAAGGLAFILYIMSPDVGFDIMLEEIAEAFSGLNFMSPEMIVQTSKYILLRGGAVATLLLLFFVNRHLSYLFASIIKKQQRNKGLEAFFAPANTIWIFSGSLAFILFARYIDVSFLQIIAWNVFVVCAIIYFAQGAGILRHLLQKRSQTFRIMVNVLIVVLVFTPLSAIVLAAVLLLGIIDIWAAFRLPKQTVQ
jgi:hypothetical protein